MLALRIRSRCDLGWGRLLARKFDVSSAVEPENLPHVLPFETSGDPITVNGANVVCGKVQTANATVHIIDTVPHA